MKNKSKGRKLTGQRTEMSDATSEILPALQRRGESLTSWADRAVIVCRKTDKWSTTAIVHPTPNRPHDAGSCDDLGAIQHIDESVSSTNARATPQRTTAASRGHAPVASRATESN